MSMINPKSKPFLKSKTKRNEKAQESNKKQKQKKNFIYSENENESDSMRSLKEEQEKDDDLSRWTKMDNSLSQLTQGFLDYIKKKGRVRISINEMVEDLKVKKRRIYDITNVLQGIGYLDKIGKNEILWIKNSNSITIPNCNNSSKDEVTSENHISNYSELKKELDELKSQKNKIEANLDKYREEFKLISEKNEFPKYGYITFDDICDLSINEKVNFMLVKAPKGTLINVIDDEESKKAFNKIKTQMDNGKIKKDDKLLNTLENIHHIFFTSQDQELKIYRIDNGKINQQLNEGSNNNYNLRPKIFQNNFKININNNINNEQKSLDNNNKYIDNNSTEKNNSNIFNFDQANINNNLNKQNKKQVFSFDENNLKLNLNSEKEEKTKDKINNNYGISSIFKI